MRKWIWGGIVLVIVAIGIVALPYARFAYLWHFYGPSALERMAVSAPTYILRYGPAPKQYADLRVPPGKGPFPIAVIIHGGCWDVSFGSSGTIAPVADALTKQGIATLNVQYRVVGDSGGGLPGTMRNVGAAIDAVRQLARRYPLDLDRLVVAGHSAGAQLALWSAMRNQLSPGSQVALPDPLLPKAVVAIDGPGALAEFIGRDADICGKPVIVPFMGGTPAQVPQRYHDASPSITCRCMFPSILCRRLSPISCSPISIRRVDQAIRSLLTIRRTPATSALSTRPYHKAKERWR